MIQNNPLNNTQNFISSPSIMIGNATTTGFMQP
jgi:hypothetical protein